LINGNLTGEEEAEVGFVEFKSYSNYIKAGGVGLFLWMQLFLVLAFGSQVYFSLWLSDWTTPATYDAKGYAKPVWQWVLLGTGVSQGLFLTVKGILLTYFTRNASLHLHTELFRHILRASTNFYDSTPLGRLISRFSKDINAIDQMVPFQLEMFLVAIYTLLAMFALLSTASPYIIIGIAASTPYKRFILPFLTSNPSIVFALYIFCSHYYRSTAIGIQRLDSISRSPIFSHLSDTLEGGATIRAYDMRKQFKVANMNNIDCNSVAFFNLRYCNVWFGLVLDLLGCLISTPTTPLLTVLVLTYLFAVGGVVLAIVMIRNFTPTGLDISLAGVALSSTNGLILNLTFLSTTFEELEVKMNSVERVEQYFTVEQEAPAHIEETKPDSKWPKKGGIKFNNLSVAYGSTKVLKDISVKIKPKQKIGLVGRTGSGKRYPIQSPVAVDLTCLSCSTLVTTLFRLIEPCNGTIEIDGLDIRTIGTYFHSIPF